MEIPNAHWLQYITPEEADRFAELQDQMTAAQLSGMPTWEMPINEEAECRRKCNRSGSPCGSFNCVAYWQKVKQAARAGDTEAQAYLTEHEQLMRQWAAALPARREQLQRRILENRRIGLGPSNDGARYDYCRCGKRKKIQYDICYTCRFGDWR